MQVALRKESVDRNLYLSSFALALALSLSARRAWIEIIDYIIDYVNDAVALRKESVDRNIDAQNFCVCVMSLSARRAWIEILVAITPSNFSNGSLSARRAWIEICCSGWLLAP